MTMNLNLAVLVVLAILAICYVETEGEVTVSEEWFTEDYPNPLTSNGAALCGSPGTQGHVCDPNQILKQGDMEKLEVEIIQVGGATECPCSKEKCEQSEYGYEFGVALMQKMALADEEMASMSEMDKREQTSYLIDINLEKAKSFANSIIVNWNLGKCQNGILIFYSLEDNMLYTALGNTTAKNVYITNDVLAKISSDVRKYFGPNQDIYEGLYQMINYYRRALNGQYDSLPNHLPDAQPWANKGVQQISTAYVTITIATVWTLISNS